MDCWDRLEEHEDFSKTQHLSLDTCLLSQLRQHLLSSAEQPGWERWARRPGGASLPKRNEKEGSTRCRVRAAFTYRTLGGCPRSRGRNRWTERRGSYFGARCDETGENESRWPAAGAAAVIQGPNSVQRTGAILSISPPEREAYLFAFDVRGVNEVGPTLDPLPRELMFVLLRAKLERRDRLRRDGEKSRFVNFKFDCFFKRIEFHDFTFKCIDKDSKERTSKGVKNCTSDICREI